MANGLRTVAGLADPVGEVLDGWKRPNGLQITRTRVPLGVIAIIYENRPNVTSDAAGLCVKAGNAVLLRGSSSALQSNIAVASMLRDALAKHALPEDAVILVEDTAYETATEVMQLTDYVDCLIPRGGPSLIKSILDNAKVPVIIDGDGNCHVYVDESADLNEAVKIVVNAKTQRPSVCNAAESLVVHAAVADAFVPRIANVLNEQGVELVGDNASRRLSAHIQAPAEATSAAVPSTQDVNRGRRRPRRARINRYAAPHSKPSWHDLDSARRFAAEVDAAAVLVNASTRFTDGEEFGYGAEIGISTQKLHARGPMGLRELTTYKYVVWGDGQIRG
jgi:glutamate-5-semialdehyde dehydrogenase